MVKSTFTRLLDALYIPDKETNLKFGIQYLVAEVPRRTVPYVYFSQRCDLAPCNDGNFLCKTTPITLRKQVLPGGARGRRRRSSLLFSLHGTRLSSLVRTAQSAGTLNQTLPLFPRATAAKEHNIETVTALATCEKPTLRKCKPRVRYAPSQFERHSVSHQL